MLDTKDSIELIAVGQSLMEHEIKPHDPDEWRALEALLSEAHVVFTNFEGTIKGCDQRWPMKSPEWCTRPDPSSLDELKKLGFNLLSLANNHSWDFGPHGVLDTITEVEKRGFVHAGTGVDLEAAEQSGTIKTPYGAVALFSMASGGIPAPAFATARRDIGPHARPGINPLRVEDVNVVPATEYERLSKILRELGHSPIINQELRLGDHVFSRGEQFVLERGIEDSDRKRHLELIANAAQTAEMVLVYVHQHHWENEWQEVGSWLQDFAYQCIDAGAHAFFGHGVPMLQAIEVYKERPILYSLGNFIFHPTAGPAYWPDRRCWQSVVAKGRFKDGQWEKLVLHPISLGTAEAVMNEINEHPSKRYPLPARGKYGEQILNDLAELSAPFGTEFDIQEDRAYLKLR